MNEAPGCRVVTRRRIDGGTFLFDVNASGMNSERAIFGEVLPVLVHHPLTPSGPFTTAIRWSFGRRSLGCYLLPTPPTDAANGRTPRRFPRHARYSSRTTKREATDRTRLARSHLAAGSPLLTESVGDHLSIHPATLGRSLSASGAR